MLAFLSSVPDSSLPPAADIAVVDDGSPPVGEILNLMARRNLLFEAVPKEAPDVALNVRIGSKEFPRKEAQNPEAFALSVRRRLTDEKRSLRLYGSEVVLARLVRDAGRARLHLLNYGGRPIDGLRVRLLGSWVPGEALRLRPGARLAVEDLSRPKARRSSPWARSAPTRSSTCAPRTDYRPKNSPTAVQRRAEEIPPLEKMTTPSTSWARTRSSTFVRRSGG